MGYLTSKKASNLGVNAVRRPGDDKDKVVDTAPRLIAPGETFNADGYDIPKAWTDMEWLVPASAEDAAAAKEREAQAEKLGVNAETLKADPAVTTERSERGERAETKHIAPEETHSRRRT